jgi:hypothetical protein
MNRIREVYVSVDLETDGPLPGRNSMLSLGAAAFLLDGVGNGNMIDTFSRNLCELPGASMDPATKLDFWDRNPEAWSAARTNPEDPLRVMRDFGNWVENVGVDYMLPGEDTEPIFVGYPVAFDFAFTHYYFMTLLGEDPFGYGGGIDIRSYGMGKLRTTYMGAARKKYPAVWLKDIGTNLTHVAVEDAIIQGRMFMNMLTQNVEV